MNSESNSSAGARPSSRLLALFFALCVVAGNPHCVRGTGIDSLASVGMAEASSESIVLFDLSDEFKLDLNDEKERHLFWDQTHLVIALEGLVNRDRPHLFVRFLKEPDDFWWEQMTQPGGWLSGRQIVRVTSMEELLMRFHGFYRGAVVWDERVPATSNLASSIAGCDNLLPLRFDLSGDSICSRLTQASNALPVKVRLLKDDGSQLFTGVGVVPGTTIASSGSTKCDAYLWLVEKYIRSGKANPQCMGYYLDSFWLNCWKVSAPENNTLCNQDYVIAHRGVLFDLGVWEDEVPVDDPQQRPGTDSATLRKLLRAAYDRFHGDGVIHVAGFVPWAFKYTDFRSTSWFAGGRHEGVPTEWRYAEILSCFNAYMDADALGLSAMANASFYQHFPLKERYTQNPRPTLPSLSASGLLDSDGRVVPRTYVAFYVGDYDSAAWLYQMLPKLWRDPARGTTPLSWAFNPNLCERFPFGMAWAREHRTTTDWFVAGDSGAGYLNPGYLTAPRPHSGLPSGLAAWERHCAPRYRQWDLGVTGFVIDGYAREQASEGLDAYARFSPEGLVTQARDRQGVHRGMPFVSMWADINEDDPGRAAQEILGASRAGSTRFVVCRSILKSPTWHARIEQELKRAAADEIKMVDMYTLLALVREYDAHPAGRARSP